MQPQGNKTLLPISIIIAGVLIAGALYFGGNKNAPVAQGPEEVKEPVLTEVTAKDHILGNPDASIKLVEYSDTECPFCKRFHATMQRIISEYGESGKVAWVYRHFPIDQLHSKARKEAEATECANELGGPTKFWEYTNMVYEITNSNNSLDPAELPIIAKSVGLDVKTFNDCLSSGKYADKIEASYQDAVKAGGRGTPNSIPVSKDGLKTTVRGAESYESLKAILDALL